MSPYNYIAEKEIWEEEVEKEMYSCRQEALRKLEVAIHPKYIDAFSKIITYAWKEECQDALRIADELDLTQIDFIALEEDYESMEELLKQRYYA